MLLTGLTALLQSPIRRVGRGVNNTASHFAALSNLGAETLQDSIITENARRKPRPSGDEADQKYSTAKDGIDGVPTQSLSRRTMIVCIDGKEYSSREI